MDSPKAHKDDADLAFVDTSFTGNEVSTSERKKKTKRRKRKKGVPPGDEVSNIDAAGKEDNQEKGKNVATKDEQVQCDVVAESIFGLSEDEQQQKQHTDPKKEKSEGQEAKTKGKEMAVEEEQEDEDETREAESALQKSQRLIYFSKSNRYSVGDLTVRIIKTGKLQFRRVKKKLQLESVCTPPQNNKNKTSF